MKSNFKNALFSLQNAIKANEKMCDILEYGYKSPFLYNPSNVDFSSNHSASKNSGIAAESIKKMLRAGTIKESLIKPKVINPLLVSTKKRLILDHIYVNGHLYKGKIKFDNWKSFRNYLE